MSPLSFDKLAKYWGGCRRETWLASGELARAFKFKRFVETGCFRGVFEDGASTILLAALAIELGGHLDSYELEPENASRAKQLLEANGMGEAVSFHAGDSLDNLSKRGDPIDFCYLDSLDCGPDPFKSQSHQLKEVEMVLPLLTIGGAVLLDDHMGSEGKTALACNRLTGLGFVKVSEGYQVLFQRRR